MNILQIAVDNLLSVTQVVFLQNLHEFKYQELSEAIRNNVMPASELNVTELREKGYIWLIDESKGQQLGNLGATELVSAWFADPSKCFDEFVAAYPRFLWIDGKRVAALNADMDELEESYDKNVVKKGLHDRVMKAVQWAAKNHEIHMGIKLWLGSRQWTAIEEIMNDTSGQRLPGARLL